MVHGVVFGLYILAKVVGFERMELAIQVQVEELPEGLFLATSDELPGLVAQGRTVAEALEIARDVARKLLAGATTPSVSTSRPGVIQQPPKSDR